MKVFNSVLSQIDTFKNNVKAIDNRVNKIKDIAFEESNSRIQELCILISKQQNNTLYKDTYKANVQELIALCNNKEG
jgi:hypothetical protein